jgi:hypothetical protein
MHATHKDRADQNPDQRRRPAKDQPRGNRADDRPGGGNRSEMSAQYDWNRRGDEIVPVLQFDGGRRTAGVDPKPFHDQPAIGEIGRHKHDGTNQYERKNRHRSISLREPAEQRVDALMRK